VIFIRVYKPLTFRISLFKFSKFTVSKYNIINNTPLIQKQRPDIVNLIISLLESNGYIKKLNTFSTSTFYQIIEKEKEGIFKLDKTLTKICKKYFRFGR
jgi:hypothetical protein